MFRIVTYDCLFFYDFVNVLFLLLMFVIVLGLVLIHVSTLSFGQLGKHTTWGLGRVGGRFQKKGRTHGGKLLW